MSSLRHALIAKNENLPLEAIKSCCINTDKRGNPLPDLTACPWCHRPFTEEEGNEDFTTSFMMLDQGCQSFFTHRGYFDRFFRVEKILGRGGQGQVLLVRHLIDGRDLGLLAMKIIPCDRVNLNPGLDEAIVLCALRHPNLIGYRHAWVEAWSADTRTCPSVPCLFLLMEYAGGGSLDQRLNQGDLPLESLLLDVCQGLYYLHQAGLMHRDLKPSNILLTTNLTALIGDLGCVRGSSQCVGTLAYLSPEIATSDLLNEETCFTEASDAWSLGMTFYHALYGELPFDEPSLQTIASIQRIKVDRGSDRLRRVLNGFLQGDLSQRMSIREGIEILSEDNPPIKRHYSLIGLLLLALLFA